MRARATLHVCACVDWGFVRWDGRFDVAPLLCMCEREMVLGCHGKVPVDRMRAMSCFEGCTSVVMYMCMQFAV